MDEYIIKAKKPTVLEETDGYAKQYRSALDVYFMKKIINIEYKQRQGTW